MRLLAAKLWVVAILAIQTKGNSLSELDLLQRRIPRTLPIELFEAGAAGVEGVPLAAGVSSPVQLTDANGRNFMCSYSHMPEVFRSASGGQRGWMPVPQLRRADPAVNAAKTTPASTSTIEKEQTISVLAGLKQLKNQCTSMNKGWWTYRLCHGSAMTQFHKDAQSEDVTGTTLCGKDPTPGKVHPTTSKTPRGVPQIRNPAEVSALPIVHTVHYGGGTACSRTDTSGATVQEARTTTVSYRCCETVLSTGAKLSHSSSIVSVEEEPQCHYQVDVCSILACTSQQKLEMASAAPSEGNVSPMPEPSADALRNEPLPPASGVNALLHAMKGSCLALHKGWWSYELCVGLNVRQFHATVTEAQQQGAGTAAIKQDVVSNALGVYMPVTRWNDKPAPPQESQPQEPQSQEPQSQESQPQESQSQGVSAEQQRAAPDAAERALEAENEIGFVLDAVDPTRSYVVQWYKGGSSCDLHQDWLVNPTTSELPLVRGVQFVQGAWRTASTVVERFVTALYRKALGLPVQAAPRTSSDKRAALHKRGGSTATAIGITRPTRSVEVRYICPHGALLEAGHLHPTTGELSRDGGRSGSSLFLETRPDGSVEVVTARDGQISRTEAPSETPNGMESKAKKSSDITYQDVVRLRSVREVAMCRYRMIVEMTSLCFHPAFAAKDTATGEPVLPGSARARAVCVADSEASVQADGVANSGAVSFGGWNMPVLAVEANDN